MPAEKRSSRIRVQGLSAGSVKFDDARNGRVASAIDVASTWKASWGNGDHYAKSYTGVGCKADKLPRGWVRRCPGYAGRLGGEGNRLKVIGRVVTSLFRIPTTIRPDLPGVVGAQIYPVKRMPAGRTAAGNRDPNTTAICWYWYPRTVEPEGGSFHCNDTASAIGMGIAFPAPKPSKNGRTSIARAVWRSRSGKRQPGGRHGAFRNIRPVRPGASIVGAESILVPASR